MTKEEFSEKLKNGLAGLPQEDIDERLTFYSEMIDDRMEEGLTEEEAVAEIGSVQTLVTQILEDTPLTKLVKEKVKPKRSLKGWEILLLVLGSPLWIALLIVLFAFLFTVYALIWSFVLLLWVVMITFLLSAIWIVIISPVFVRDTGGKTGFELFFAGIMLIGFSIFMFFGCKAFTKFVWKLSKKIAVGIKSLFVGKDN